MALTEVISHIGTMLPYLIALTLFAAALTYYKRTLDRLEDDD